MLEQAGVSAIAVHGRTRTQMYAGQADWTTIRQVKGRWAFPSSPTATSTPEDAVRILAFTGADMAMIGRGCFGNPWLFQQAQAALAGQPIPPLPPLAERWATAVRQVELSVADKGSISPCWRPASSFAGISRASATPIIIRSRSSAWTRWRMCTGCRRVCRGICDEG